MGSHRMHLLLLAVAALAVIAYALRAAWHELCNFMRNQRFGD